MKVTFGTLSLKGGGCYQEVQPCDQRVGTFGPLPDLWRGERASAFSQPVTNDLIHRGHAKKPL